MDSLELPVERELSAKQKEAEVNAGDVNGSKDASTIYRKPSRQAIFERKAESQKLIRSARAQLQPTVLHRKTLVDLLEKIPVSVDSSIKATSASHKAGNGGIITLEDSDSDSDVQADPIRHNSTSAALSTNVPHISALDLLRVNLRHQIALQNIKRRQKLQEKAEVTHLSTPNSDSADKSYIPSTDVDSMIKETSMNTADSDQSEQSNDSDEEEYVYNSEEEEQVTVQDDSASDSEQEVVDDQEVAVNKVDHVSDIGSPTSKETEQPYSELASTSPQSDKGSPVPKSVNLRKRRLHIISDEEDEDKKSDDANIEDVQSHTDDMLFDPPVSTSSTSEDNDFHGGALTDLCVPTPQNIVQPQPSQDMWRKLQQQEWCNTLLPIISFTQADSMISVQPSNTVDMLDVSLPLMSVDDNDIKHDMGVGYMTSDGLLLSQLAQPMQIDNNDMNDHHVNEDVIDTPELSSVVEDGIVGPTKRRLVSRKEVKAQEEEQVLKLQQRSEEVNAYIEKEAYESEDEFMGLGGEDGEDSDDEDAMNDEIVTEDNAEEAAQGADDVKALAAKQLFDDEQAAIKKITNELMSGGLSLGRRHQMDMHGKGYGLEDINESDVYGDEEQKRRALRKKRTKFSSVMEKFADHPETAPFAQAFASNDELYDFVPPEPDNFVSVELDGHVPNPDEDDQPISFSRSLDADYIANNDDNNSQPTHIPKQIFAQSNKQKRSRSTRASLLRKPPDMLQRYIINNVQLLNLDKGGVKTPLQSEGRRKKGFHHQVVSEPIDADFTSTALTDDLPNRVINEHPYQTDSIMRSSSALLAVLEHR